MNTLDRAIHERLQRFYRDYKNPIKKMLLFSDIHWLYKLSSRNNLLWYRK